MFERLKRRTQKTSKFVNLPDPTNFSRSPGTSSAPFKGNEADRLVRCKHCGFICDKERDARFPDGSYAGFGIAQGTQLTTGESVGDRKVPETSLTGHLLYWQCEDSAADGTVAATIGANGSVQNDVSSSITTTGKLGNGFRCSDLGAEGSSWIHSTVDLSIYDEFSLSIWFQATDTSFGQHIIQQGRGQSGGWSRQTWAAATDVPEFHVSLGWVHVEESIERDDFLTFYIGRYSTDSAGHISIGYAFTDTADWHHVAVSVSDLSTKPYARMWIDGVHRDRDWGTVDACAMSGAGEGLRLCKPPADTGNFYGSVDDFRVFTHALNTLEVLAIYNSGAGTTRYGSSVSTIDTYYDRNVNGGCPCCGSYIYG